MNGIGASFLILDLFSLTFKNIFLVLLLGAGAIAPAPMDPPLTDHLLLARVSVRGRGRVTLDHSTNLSKDMLCYPAEAKYSSFDLSLFGSMISHAADVPVSTNFFVFYPRARRYASTVL